MFRVSWRDTNSLWHCSRARPLPAAAVNRLLVLAGLVIDGQSEGHGLILVKVPTKPGEAKNHFGCLPRDLRLPREERPAVAASWISLGAGGQGH
jgi:hypothetical protein